MKTWLDEATFDLANPRAARVYECLSRGVTETQDLQLILRRAGVPSGRVRWTGRIDHEWAGALDAAAAADKLRALLHLLLTTPAYANIGAELKEILGEDAPRAESAPAAEETGQAGGRAFDWRGAGGPPSEGKEALIHKAMVDASFFRLGRKRSDSVVRLSVDDERYGTGSLIGPDLILTNHHVLFDEATGQRASSVVAWFRYEQDDEKKDLPDVTRDGDPEVILSDEDADWAIIRLTTPAPDDIPVLPLVSGKVKPGQRAHIVQHPRGGRKKLALFDNDVRYVDEKVIQYLTDTEEGSSGSPVFNDRWETVALHHAWKSVALPGGEREIRNEGVAIGRVLQGLRDAGVHFGQGGASLGEGGTESQSRKGDLGSSRDERAAEGEQPAPEPVPLPAPMPAPGAAPMPGSTPETAHGEMAVRNPAGAPVLTRKPPATPDEKATPMPVQEPVRLYISAHAKDRKLVEELVTGLAPFVKQRVLAIWHRGMLRAGEFVSAAVQRELREARLFALVGSADALADDEIQSEWTLAVERQKKKTARTIAILAKAALLEYSVASDLLIFPDKDSPLEGHAQRARAMQDIVREILAMTKAPTP